MILENVKLFETGNYTQGKFPVKRVNEIFKKLKNPVKAQFAHSKYWKNKKEEPVEVGEFLNFQLSDGVISANIDLNEKGEEYYKDGIIKSCSVEMLNDEITRVAVLPIGVNPAITGTDFEEQNILEFEAEIFQKDDETIIFELDKIIEEVKMLDVTAENKEMFFELSNVLWEKIDEKEYIEKLENKGYKIEKEFEEVPKNESEIREEIKKEFEAEKEGMILFEKLKKDGKITPAMEKAGMNENLLSNIIYNKNDVLEFQETTVNHESIIKIFEAMPNFVNMKGSKTKIEYKKTEEKQGTYAAIKNRINVLKNN